MWKVIYLTIMVSLRSSERQVTCQRWQIVLFSGKAKKVAFFQNILVETLFVNGTILVIKFP
jgi:hypothetical protein